MNSIPKLIFLLLSFYASLHPLLSACIPCRPSTNQSPIPESSTNPFDTDPSQDSPAYTAPTPPVRDPSPYPDSPAATGGVTYQQEPISFNDPGGFGDQDTFANPAAFADPSAFGDPATFADPSGAFGDPSGAFGDPSGAFGEPANFVDPSAFGDPANFADPAGFANASAAAAFPDPSSSSFSESSGFPDAFPPNDQSHQYQASFQAFPDSTDETGLSFEQQHSMFSQEPSMCPMPPQSSPMPSPLPSPYHHHNLTNTNAPTPPPLTISEPTDQPQQEATPSFNLFGDDNILASSAVQSVFGKIPLSPATQRKIAQKSPQKTSTYINKSL